MSNIIVNPISGVIEFNTGDPSGSAFYTSTAPIRLDATGGNSWFTGANVGIGTNAPTEMLGIAPNTDVSAEIGRAHVGYIGHSDYAGFSHLDQNTTTNYALLQQSNGATYLNAKAAKDIYFKQGGSTKGGFNTSSDFYVDTDTLYVDASEDSVGIGTNSPLATLDVRGNISGSGSFLGTGVGNRITNNGTPYLLSGDSPAETQTLQDVTTNGNTTNTSITSTGPYISGNGTGFFGSGIGIGTIAPAELLGVAPNTNVSAEIGRAHVGHVGHSDYAGFSHVDKNTTTSYALLQQSNGATYLNASSATNIYFKMGGTTIGGFNSDSDFHVGTDSLYVDSSADRVGCGTASPSYTLEVTKSKSSSLLSRFYNSSSTNGQGLLIRAGEVGNANRVLQVASRTDSKIMTVNSNGKVGIGTVTPTVSLEVTGTIKCQVSAIASLPSASPAGQKAFVNDSYYPHSYSYLGNTVYAGASYFVPVYSDGTYWRYG